MIYEIFQYFFTDWLYLSILTETKNQKMVKSSYPSTLSRRNHSCVLRFVDSAFSPGSESRTRRGRGAREGCAVLYCISASFTRKYSKSTNIPHEHPRAERKDSRENRSDTMYLTYQTTRKDEKWSIKRKKEKYKQKYEIMILKIQNFRYRSGYDNT